ncbi:MAG: class I SAM-dependent methyltransferase [Candidatus Promineofilum sp.]|nr:class I SAM-dependent methyltransferase [Promineifilum sp.]
MTSNPSQPKPSWAGGERYEPYVGRWSRLVAREFVSWLALPAGLAWLDVGCGTGSVTQAILDLAQPVTVKSIDASSDFIAYARAHVTGGAPSFEVGDAQALPLDAGVVDVAVSGLVFNFLPDPPTAAREMARVTRPGGAVALYVWDYGGKMEFMRYFWDAATALNPAAAELDEGSRFSICRPEPLTALLTEAGLQDVETRPIDVATVFRDFDDYWSPFLGAGGGPGPRYLQSLDEGRRAALREKLRADLPAAEDGTIPLIARAWAVKGRRV